MLPTKPTKWGAFIKGGAKGTGKRREWGRAFTSWTTEVLCLRHARWAEGVVSRPGG
jgi:hypothetical protein